MERENWHVSSKMAELSYGFNSFPHWKGIIVKFKVRPTSHSAEKHVNTVHIAVHCAQGQCTVEMQGESAGKGSTFTWHLGFKPVQSPSSRFYFSFFFIKTKRSLSSWLSLSFFFFSLVLLLSSRRQRDLKLGTMEGVPGSGKMDFRRGFRGSGRKPKKRERFGQKNEHTGRISLYVTGDRGWVGWEKERSGRKTMHAGWISLSLAGVVGLLVAWLPKEENERLKKGKKILCVLPHQGVKNGCGILDVSVAALIFYWWAYNHCFLPKPNRRGSRTWTKMAQARTKGKG